MFKIYLEYDEADFFEYDLAKNTISKILLPRTDFKICPLTKNLRYTIPYTDNGWVLCLPSNIIALDDITKLFAFKNEKYAVMVAGNVILWNCEHEGNYTKTFEPRFDVEYLNTWESGKFPWLREDEIGVLPIENIIHCVTDPKNDEIFINEYNKIRNEYYV